MATKRKAPRPMTAEQLKLLNSLVKQVEIPIEFAACLSSDLERGMTTKETSSYIGRLFEMRDTARAERRAA